MAGPQRPSTCGLLMVRLESRPGQLILSGFVQPRGSWVVLACRPHPLSHGALITPGISLSIFVFLTHLPKTCSPSLRVDVPSASLSLDL